MALQTKTFSSSTTSNEYTLKLTVTENSINTNNNTSNVSYRLYMTSGGWDFETFAVGWEISLNGKVVSSMSREDAPQIDLGVNSSVTIASGTTNIAHRSDGTLKNMAVSGESYMAKESYTPGNMSVTGSMTLTPINLPEPPVKSEIDDIFSFDVERGISVPFTSHSEDYTHKLSLVYGSTTIFTIDKYTSNQTIYLTVDQILQVYSLFTGMSANFTFKLQTYDGSSLVGTDSVSVTGNVKGSIKQKIYGMYRDCKPWIKVNGVWKPTFCYNNVDGAYRRSNN